MTWQLAAAAAAATVTGCVYIHPHFNALVADFTVVIKKRTSSVSLQFDRGAAGPAHVARVVSLMKSFLFNYLINEGK